MAEQFNADWARGVIDTGMQKAQGLIDDPSQVQGLMSDLQAKMKDLPSGVAGTLQNIPLMASMVKSYVTREYTEVSPKVVVTVVSALLYVVKRKDLIPDTIPVVGLADDVAVITLAMKINEPELQAYAEWRDAHALPAPEILTEGENLAEMAVETETASEE